MEQSLIYVAREGSVEDVERYLRSGVDVNFRSGWGYYTPLHVASENGHTEVVKLLLKYNANPNISDQNGQTPLHVAGNEVIAECLINSGADINRLDNNGQTPLYEASSNGHTEVVELLLKYNADPNISSKWGCTPLYKASSNSHTEVVKLLLEYNADPNISDMKGQTPLHVARNEVIAECLINSGADINRLDNYGRIPLYVACKWDHTEVVKLLLKYNADPNISDKNGQTPLHVADNEVIAECLINSGATINRVDKDGRTPLYVASKHGHTEVVKLLLKYNANPNISDMNGQTPLHVAGNEVIAECLINSGVDINRLDIYGRTPLYVASSHGHTEVVKLLLLKYNADPNISDKDGQTPLHEASSNGHTKLVKLLLKHNADPNISDKNGQTPLHVADNDVIVDCLINGGADVNRFDHQPLYLRYYYQCYYKVRVIKAILKYKPDLNIDCEDWDRNPNLHYACMYGYMDVVQCLVKNGASVKALNESNKTPIDFLSRSYYDDSEITYEKKRILKWLKEMGLLANDDKTFKIAQLRIQLLKKLQIQKKKDIKLFKKAVERKGSVSYLMVQCMPFGPPRVGKTCIYNLLINRPPPGKPTSKNKIGKGSLSTDALTGRTIINARVRYRDSAKAIVAKGGSNWSEVTTLDDEIALYVETTKEQLGKELDNVPVKNDGTIQPYMKIGRFSSDVQDDYCDVQPNSVEESQVNNDEATDECIIPNTKELSLHQHEVKTDKVEAINHHNPNTVTSEIKDNQQKNEGPIAEAVSHQHEVKTDAKVKATHHNPNTSENHENQQRKQEPIVEAVPLVNLEDTVLNEITKPLVSDQVDLSSVQSLVKDSLTIFYTDTGGQPEFQEVLPALIAGPTMFLLAFSLFSPKLVKRKILPGNKVVSCDPLNAFYQVRYDSSEDKFGDYESSFTVSDVLLQCLSSIACFKDGQTHQLMLERDSGNVHISSPPISVLILGTHRDLVQQEDVEQVDQLLRQSLINVDLMGKGFIEEYEYDKQLIIPINNYDPSDSSKLQQVIERVVNRAEGKNGTSPYRIELPVHWLGLELYLRKLDQSTISFKECVKVASKFDIPKSELKYCLKYLHYKTGTIRYYSGVEELNNTIIIKPSIIFSAITKLITSTFIPKNVKGDVQLKFKQYGLFKESEIQHIFEANEKSLELTLNQFLALLRHLNILSQAYKMASSHCIEDEPQFDYFLPCALSHAPIKDTSDDKPLLSTKLLVSFQNGFVPKGIFSGLLASFSGLKWEIICNKSGQPLLYRNQATFNINEHLCSLTMRAEPKFLEFYVKFNSPSAPDDSFQTVAYANLRNTIQESLTLECETLGYGQTWSLGVYCSGCDECQPPPPHVTTVDLKDDGRVIGQCSITNEAFLLSEEQRCWFKSPEAVVMKDDHLQPEVKLTEMASLEDPSKAITIPQLTDLVDIRTAFKLTKSLSSYWEEIGRGLGLTRNDRRIIERQEQSINNRLEAVLEKWIEKEGTPKWLTLITALKEEGFINLADSIQDKLSHD